MKHLTFCALLFMGLQSLGVAQYSLTVESYPAVDTTMTTYRVYVNFDDANDQLSAVFGNDEYPMQIDVPDGAFNSAYNTGWSASGINPSFLPVFPELADDTYATIRLEGPAATSGIADAADPSIVEDAAQQITPFFIADGSTQLLSSTLTGAAWYVLNTNGNAYPDEDLRSLILQITTSGSISGTINYQVFNQFVEGSGDEVTAIKLSADFDGVGTFNPGGEEIPGCTDETACNYNASATVDDDSCTYIDPEACDCAGNTLDAVGVCGGDCTEDDNGDGVCDGSEVYGCMSPGACNYNPEANLPDPENPCVGVADGWCDCEETIADTDNDGVCDEDEVAGCTDGMACNYDPEATDDDGSCEFCSCAENAFTLTVDSMSAMQEGLTTYRVYMNTVDTTDRISALFSDEDIPMIISVPEGAWNSPNSSTWNASGVNPALFNDFPNILDDSYATIGLDGPAAPLGQGYQDPSLLDPDFDVTDLFTMDGDTGFVSNSFPGLSWFVTNDALNGLPDPETGQILLLQITTSGSISGTLNYQVFPRGNQDNDLILTTSFDGVGTFGQVNVCGCMEVNACNYNPEAMYEDPNEDCEYESCQGCTDMEACNFDPEATLSDEEACTYPDEGYDCNGDCIDSNMNDTCDFDESGCMDDMACNYDETALIDDGSCEFAIDLYPSGWFDCDGECYNDADGDGVCDEEEIDGCTDMEACNYDVYATDDDGSCEYAIDLYPDGYYDCDGNCINDADEDGVCDELEVPGCTDANACNYNMDATDDDGSCTYPEEEYLDCEGNCLNDADEDGVCDELEVAGCTDEAACNYDDMATDSDDSCEYPGDSCDDGDETTINDAYNADCECVGEVDGVEEAGLSFGMFPNPTTGEVTLSVAGFHTGVTVQVLDGAGRVVWTEQNVALQGNTVLDLSGLSSGTYNVMLSDERGVSVKRLAIQR